MKSQIFFLLSISLFTFIVGQRSPVVTTKLGNLRGVRQFSSLFHSFYAFKGIPYAKPPLNELRFRNPEPITETWEGIKDATSHGSTCPFMRLGNEDCLYLNVYTQKLNEKLPVMFWIHGGAFILGDGNSLVYGPDFLVREDVCIVTINYRLSALGFLSTGDEYAQGNYGLKDIVLALKWVNDNIEAFGCNAENITIFGQSAGSVAVNLLMMSDMADNLFQQAIMQSGTSLAPFMLQLDPKKQSEQIANNLNLTYTSSESLVDELRKVDFRDIIEAERFLLNMDQPLGARAFDFVPVVEPENSTQERFLIDTPFNILKNGKFRKVPLMIGTTSKEGLLMIRPAQLDKDTFKRYNENENFFVPLSFELEDSSEQSQEVANKFREMYFHGTNLSFDMLNEWAIFHTDLQFEFPTDRLLSAFSTSNFTSAIFKYNFSYSGALNFLKTLLFLRSFEGACHFDENFYLFSAGFPLPVWPTDHALTVRRRMIKMWTNFAKFGHPTPSTDNTISTIWPHFDSQNQSYLDIGYELSVKSHHDNENLKVWREFQQRFTGHF